MPELPQSAPCLDDRISFDASGTAVVLEHGRIALTKGDVSLLYDVQALQSDPIAYLRSQSIAHRVYARGLASELSNACTDPADVQALGEAARTFVGAGRLFLLEHYFSPESKALPRRSRKDLRRCIRLADRIYAAYGNLA